MTSVSNNQEYLEGITFLRYYAIISFLSLAAGIIVVVAFIGTFPYGYIVGGVGASLGAVSFTSGNFDTLLAYAGIISSVTTVLAIAGIFMLYRGFGTLRELDEKFSLGRTGTILEVVGMVMLLVGTIALISIMPSLLAVANGPTAGSAMQAEFGTILATIALIAVAAIITLVGMIFVIIGLFRVGSQFNNSLVEVGAILILFLGIIGTILLYLGLTEIINKLRVDASSMDFVN